VENIEIATRRPPSAASKPFVTRQSTLFFCGLFLLGAVACELFLQADPSGTSGFGVLAAVAGATALVAGGVAWVNALVIAVRSGSVLWLVVAVLPIVPINALMCAMFCPAATTEKRR
jgi:hypothetical protein